MFDLQECESELERINTQISELKVRQQAIRNEIRNEKARASRNVLSELVSGVFKLNPHLRYAAMDRTGRILFYREAPSFQEGSWKGTPEKIGNSGSRYQVTATNPPAYQPELRIYYWVREAPSWVPDDIEEDHTMY